MNYLTKYELDRDPELLRLAVEVMSGDEPDLRRMGMVRI